MSQDPAAEIERRKHGEIARRREADRQARACNRIEGIPHDPAADPIFEAWILGEIDSEELMAAIKAFLGVP